MRAPAAALLIAALAACSAPPDAPYGDPVVDAKGMVRHRHDSNFVEEHRYFIKGTPIEDGCMWSGSDTVRPGDDQAFVETMIAANYTTCEGIMARGYFLRDPDSLQPPGGMADTVVIGP